VVDVSPDGHSVLTSSAKEESNLWRVNVASGLETPIARDLTAKLWPSVSPDNGKIAFQSIRNLSQGNKLFTGSIAVTSIKQRDDGSSASVIAEQGSLPAWSPDGSNVAYAKHLAESSRDLFTVGTNGGAERRLTTAGLSTVGHSVTPYNTTTSHSFAWSPDGTRIAYLSQQNGASNVWAVDHRTAESVMLTANADAGRSLYCPVWSGDGKRIAIAFEQRGKEAADKVSYGLTIVNLDKGVSSDVYGPTRSHRLIGWTADESGLIIAEPSKLFIGLPPETTLKLIRVDSESESTIAVLKNAYFYNIFLSYDQRSIAFAARNDDRDDLWIIPAIGGAARKITSNNDSALYYSRLAWFHDGSSIAFGKQTRFSLLSMITGID
jgi:Tol biopolymer transport system component